MGIVAVITDAVGLRRSRLAMQPVGDTKTPNPPSYLPHHRLSKTQKAFP